MDCKDFAAWLITRRSEGLGDVAEALQHARECAECRKKLDPNDRTDAMLLVVLREEMNVADDQDVPAGVFVSHGKASGSKLKYTMIGVAIALLVLFAFFGIGSLLV